MEYMSLLQAAALGGQWLQDNVTLVYIEVKQEAGSGGDAQQEGMVYNAQDCRRWEWQGPTPCSLHCSSL